jgi:hypothetical protein
MKARQFLAKILSPFAVVLMMTFAGPAITAPVDNPSQAEPPVDCKKTPDHPRCKDQKK